MRSLAIHSHSSKRGGHAGLPFQADAYHDVQVELVAYVRQKTPRVPAVVDSEPRVGNLPAGAA